MKYYVTFAVDGRYVAEVEADNLRDAKYEAMDSCGNADFGELRDVVDAEMIMVEDENGAYVWEK